MRMTSLDLDRIPPLHVPFRFFLAAPWFGVLAALVLLFGGPQLWMSQWTPVLIGVAHLVTLGFMTMIMLGALFQFIPVLSGEPIPAEKPVSLVVHLFLIAGVLCLCTGFVLRQYVLLGPAVLFLAISLVSFIVAIGSRLAGNIRGGDTIHAMRLAVVALLITTSLGFYRALGYVYQFESSPDLSVIHLGWGLIGWVLMLIAGISFQIIPMFHLTPDYPAALSRGLPYVLFSGLLLISLVRLPAAVNGLVFVLGVTILVYAGYSLRLLQLRKRMVAEVTARFWRLGLINLILAVLIAGLFFYLPGYDGSASISGKALILAGVLVIMGFACSIIFGMLQKIVPFLIYLHLQRSCLADIRAIKSLPPMHEIIIAGSSKWLFRIHCAAIAAMACAVIHVPLARVAALVLLLDFGWLAFQLSSAALLYMRIRSRLAAIQAVTDDT